jgi:hypothetical protein
MEALRNRCGAWPDRALIEALTVKAEKGLLGGTAKRNEIATK